jgi:hypothetical protein
MRRLGEVCNNLPREQRGNVRFGTKRTSAAEKRTCLTGKINLDFPLPGMLTHGRHILTAFRAKLRRRSMAVNGSPQARHFLRMASINPPKEEALNGASEPIALMQL